MPPEPDPGDEPGSESRPNRLAEFWKQLPDVLKALAALIGAIATLVGALATANLIGSGGDGSPTPSPTATATAASSAIATATATVTQESETPTATATASPEPTRTPSPTPTPVTYEALEPIPLDHQPEDVVAAFGSVWIASERAVTRIDQRSYQVQTEIPILLLANAIAADATRIWVAASNDERLLSINPSTNREQTHQLGTNPTLFDIAAGDGTVWITDLFDASLLTFDAQAGSAGDSLPLFVNTGQIFAGGTWRIAYGPEEGTWVTAGTSGQVFRIEPAERRGREVVGLSDNRITYNIAVGLGKVWVQLRGSSDLLLIDADDESWEIVTVDAPEGTAIEAVAVGADAVWILQRRGGSNGLVSRLNPETLSVEASVTVPPVSDGSSIIVVGDEVWVTHRIEALLSVVVPNP